MKKRFLLAGILAVLAACANLSAADLTLWYQQPASDKKPMDEALPIGNGRMGALIFGQPDRERICVNEDSLWTGGENSSGNYDTMGAYQVLGNVFVNLPGHDQRHGLPPRFGFERCRRAGQLHGRRREVSARIFLQPSGASSRGAIFRGQTGSLHGHAWSCARATTRKSSPTEIGCTASGTLDNGMKFEWQLLVLNHGGSVKLIPGIADQTNAAQIEFSNCDSLTLLIAAGTDYVFDYAKSYHGDDPHARVTAQLDAAAKKSFAELHSEHVADYQSLFNRVSCRFRQIQRRANRFAHRQTQARSVHDR